MCSCSGERSVRSSSSSTNRTQGGAEFTRTDRPKTTVRRQQRRSNIISIRCRTAFPRSSRDRNYGNGQPRRPVNGPRSWFLRVSKAPRSARELPKVISQSRSGRAEHRGTRSPPVRTCFCARLADKSSPSVVQRTGLQNVHCESYVSRFYIRTDRRRKVRWRERGERFSHVIATVHRK